MIPSSRLAAALAYVQDLASATYGLKIPATAGNRVAGSLFALAQEHHHAIVLLLREERYASSIALLRPAFEAYVRGAWIDACGNDAEIERFVKGHEPPAIGKLVEALERTERFEGGVLSAFKKRYWAALCDYTHSGSLHVQRWNSAEAIEPSYESEELVGVLRLTEYLGGLAATGTVRLAEREDLIDGLLSALQKLHATDARHAA